MATQPFIWGNNGQQLSPGQVDVLRALASARANRPVAQNLGEGLAAVGDALVANSANLRADEAEQSGRARVAQAIADARASGDPASFYKVLEDDWASPGQQMAANAILGRQYAMDDREAEWGREDALRTQDRSFALGDRDAGWAREDQLLADQRAYDQPVRDAQLVGANIQNETGQLGLDRLRSGYRQLILPGERAAAGIPVNDLGMYQIGPDGQIAPVGGKGGITINTAPGGGDASFYEAASTQRGKDFVALESAGRDANTRIGQINRLESLLAGSPQGLVGAATQFAGELGLPLEGLDSLQAAQALINKMVPQQRPPGSGTMSDADLALFKQSLPRIINQPGGNELIIQTLKGVAVYEQAMGDIATRVLNRDITPAEGQVEMKAVPNPLELFRALDDAAPDDVGNPPAGVDPAAWAELTPEERALWN